MGGDDVLARQGADCLGMARAGEGRPIGVLLAIKERWQRSERDARRLGQLAGDPGQLLRAKALDLARREGGVLDDVRHQVERGGEIRSEEHTSELQSLMRISYAVFCLKKKKNQAK